jgi:hypothetical protein
LLTGHLIKGGKKNEKNYYDTINHRPAGFNFQRAILGYQISAATDSAATKDLVRPEQWPAYAL